MRSRNGVLGLRSLSPSALSLLVLGLQLGTVQSASAGWSSMFASQHLNGTVQAIAEFNGELIVGGLFTMGGTTPVKRVARWTGSNWDSLGAGVNSTVNALAVYDGKLYVGGNFTQAGGQTIARIACWNGTSWSPVGTGINGQVFALHVFQSELYAGGAFTNAGGTAANNIARWNGSTWSAVGTGTSQAVNAMASDQTRLAVVGEFTTAGDKAANRAAIWNGSSWSLMGTGVTASALATTIWNGDIYVGGAFVSAGGTAVAHIAKWNGASWQSAGATFGSWVTGLTVYNGDIVATGFFETSGHQYISRNSGGGWATVGTGLNAEGWTVFAAGPWLYVGGFFTEAGAEVSHFVGAWSDITVDVEPGPGSSAQLTLRAAAPNPFREQVSLSYELPAAANVSLRLYDARGRHLVTLEEGPREAGRHQAVWNGTSRGVAVGPGVYFAQLQAGAEIRTTRIVRVTP